MEKIDREVRRLIALALKVSFLPLLGMFWLHNWQGVRGYLLGLSASILAFIMMSRQAWRLTGLASEEKARKMAFGNYVTRLTFYAFILIVAAKRIEINFAATAVGLVMIKFVLVGEAVLKNIKDILMTKIKGS